MDTQTRYCSRCGTSVYGSKFCQECGYNLVAVGSQFHGANVQPLPNAVPRTSSLAITAFVVSFFISWVGIILGYLARKEIRESNGTLAGDGLAQGAIIVGWIWTGLLISVGIVWGISAGASGFG